MQALTRRLLCALEVLIRERGAKQRVEAPADARQVRKARAAQRAGGGRVGVHGQVCAPEDGWLFRWRTRGWEGGLTLGGGRAGVCKGPLAQAAADAPRHRNSGARDGAHQKHAAWPQVLTHGLYSRSRHMEHFQSPSSAKAGPGVSMLLRCGAAVRKSGGSRCWRLCVPLRTQRVQRCVRAAVYMSSCYRCYPSGRTQLLSRSLYPRSLACWFPLCYDLGRGTNAYIEWVVAN
jgi:hypothetical protein